MISIIKIFIIIIVLSQKINLTTIIPPLTINKTIKHSLRSKQFFINIIFIVAINILNLPIIFALNFL